MLALGLVLLLTIQVIGYRVKLILLNKRKEYLKQVWRPFINQAMHGGKPALLMIKNRDIYHILEEVNYVFSIIKGNETEALRKACHDLELHVKLFKLLKSNNIRKKLYALITLGNLHHYMAWDQIKNNLNHKQTIISLTAAKSLIQIDPEKALVLILPLILTRNDWPWANMAHMLKTAGASRVCKPLSEMIQTMPVALQASFLRLFEIIQCDAISPITRTILEQTDDDKVASVCLHISQDPAIVPLARQYSTHKRWHVRMHAASALGRFGGENEIEILVELLKDREWWVRYRSAQAMTSMPFLTIERLMSIRDSINDRYAKDMLGQVITEKQ